MNWRCVDVFFSQWGVCFAVFDVVCDVFDNGMWDVRPYGVVVLLCLISTWTCVVVSISLVVCSLCVFLSICLFVLCLLCLTVLVNCLLDAFATCVGEVNVFSLKIKLMCSFWVVLGFLLDNPCMVFP